jgi:hypothetical protein
MIAAALLLVLLVLPLPLLLLRQARAPPPPPGRGAGGGPARGAVGAAARAWYTAWYTALETAVDCWVTPLKVRRQRGYVLRELLDTEAFYVERLRHVIDRFILPLRAAGQGAQADAVWRGWEPITELHEDFLEKLREATRAPPPTPPRACCRCNDADTAVPARRVAAEFSTLAPMLLLYIPFVKAYGTALGRLSADLRCGGPISTVSSGGGGGGGGGRGSQQPADLLALPFQRLCKYGLLLRELVRTFPGGRGQALRDAMSVVDETVKKVNDAKARSETSERALQIQSALHVGNSGGRGSVGSREGHRMGRGFNSIWKTLRRESEQGGGSGSGHGGGGGGGGGGDGSADNVAGDHGVSGHIHIMQAHRRLVWEGGIGGGLSVARLPHLCGARAVAWEERWSISGQEGCWVAIFSDLVLIAERRAPNKWKEERLELRWVCEVGALEIVDEPGLGGGGGGGGSVVPGEEKEKSRPAEGKSSGNKSSGMKSSAPTELLLKWRRPSPYCKVLLRLAWTKEDARAAADVCGVFRSLLK